MTALNTLIKRMGAEVESIVKSAIEISYYSRGAWSYHSVLMMTQGEREIAVNFINERLKAASKSLHPVY